MAEVYGPGGSPGAGLPSDGDPQPGKNPPDPILPVYGLDVERSVTMLIELIGSLLILGLPLALAVIITAVDEHRQRRKARESERRAVKKIKEEKRRKAA